MRSSARAVCWSFALTTGWARVAAAQAEPCAIPPAGEVVCEDVVIDGTLSVRPYEPASVEPTGWLHLRARRITVTATGFIDAIGAGHPPTLVGAEPSAGGGPGGGQRGVPASVGAPAPGGGGAHVGAGGQGMLDKLACTLSTTALGGSAYDDPAAPLALMSPIDPLRGLGSAGGASYCGDTGAQVRGGGRGGGVVILTAAVIELDGRIAADGEGLGQMSPNLGLCGPGAGAGGAIIVRGHELSLGPNAALSAAGGESPRTLDASAMDATNSWGGGGGGGLVTLFVGGTAAGLTVDVRGGAAPCPAGAGADGGFLIAAPTECVDADRDGHPSAVCGGPDCHDGDPSVSPDGVERCDGIDNDCDGAIDEDPDSLCPAGSGSTCVDGTCAPMASGPGGAPPLGAGPNVELGGGLCTTSGDLAPARRGGGGWLALTLLLAVWRRGRAKAATQ